MKKTLFFLIIFCFLCLKGFCNDEINTIEPIKTTIKYNEATARLEAFKDIERKVDKDFLKQFYKDKNRYENLEAIKNNISQIKDRYLCPFYLKDNLISYSIIYEEYEDYVFYYDILGRLVKFDKVQHQDTYPRKVLGYSRYGNLISVAFEVDENEHFVYDENGKLSAHWIGSEVYNNKNKIPKFLQLKRGIKTDNEE